MAPQKYLGFPSKGLLAEDLKEGWDVDLAGG